MSRYIFSCSLLLGVFSINPLAGQTCDPNGEVRFICGLTNPEDLYQIPDTPWVIASGRVSDVDGPIYAVDIRNDSSRVIFRKRPAIRSHHTGFAGGSTLSYSSRSSLFTVVS